jgi:adenylosuccinate synthase
MAVPKPIVLIQGAQWGSEGKGMVAAALGARRKVDICVRTGTVNAGHTVYKDGVAYKMQQLPVGWVHGADLVIGPGAYIHPDIFYGELKMVRNAGYRGRVMVDFRCGLHLPEHTGRSTLSGRHYSMGATGKGCSEAIIDKIRNRGSGGLVFRDYPQEPLPTGEGWEFNDTVEVLNGAYDAGKQILVEGTQGTMLDLHIGPYPFTTHKQCTAAAWVTEAGLSPSLDYEVVLVARTYPIRVAGNSGPMDEEITWPELAREINEKLKAKGLPPRVEEWALRRFDTAWAVADRMDYASEYEKLSEQNRRAFQQLDEATVAELGKLFEFTTVTKKLRRVARLDIPLLRYSVMINRPDTLCLTFVNYEFPELWGAKEFPPYPRATDPVWDYLLHLGNSLGHDVNLVTTGPEAAHFHDIGR